MSILNNLKFFLPILLIFLGCHDSKTNYTDSKISSISITLADESGDFEAEGVAIIDVMIKMDDANDWIWLHSKQKKGTHDILVNKYPVATGTVKQLKLVLKNTLGDSRSFLAQSGLKINLDTDIEAGYSYDVVLDFDANISNGLGKAPGRLHLRSVTRVANELRSGIIEGSISPASEPTKVSIETEDDEIISAYTNYAGHFAIWGVPTGTYKVMLTPVDSNSKYKATTIPNIQVVNGKTTVIRSIL